LDYARAVFVFVFVFVSVFVFDYARAVLGGEARPSDPAVAYMSHINSDRNVL
jgi:hypothetical protein